MVGPPSPLAPADGYLGDVIGGSAVLGVLSGSNTTVEFNEQLLIGSSASAGTSTTSIGTTFTFEASCTEGFSPTVDGATVSPKAIRADGYKVYRLDVEPSDGSAQRIETYDVTFGAVLPCSV
jgi:hypothetical protein